MAVAVWLASLSLARFDSFQNQTFDLAFYAQMAWALVHGNPWNPVLNAPVYALHISPVLVPLALPGLVFGMVPTLLTAQAAALSFTAIPLSRLAQRMHVRWTIAALWWLFPTVFAVATYEFHPVALAALPAAYLLVALRKDDPHLYHRSAVALILCREDLALILVFAALVHRRRCALRPTALRWGWAAGIYFALFALVLVPVFGPEHGSLALHFGPWTQGPGGAPGALLDSRFWQHLLSAERLDYLVSLMAPTAGLALLAPGTLALATPFLAINLISVWPTAIALTSHYQIIVVPFIVGAAAIVLGNVRASWLRMFLCLAVLVAATSIHRHRANSPLAIGHDPSAFTPGPHTEHANHIVSRIPHDAPVQAPDAMLPHLAERHHMMRAGPLKRATQFAVLDVTHRETFAHKEDLIRTEEEPLTLRWLMRPQFSPVAHRGPYLLLQRGENPRGGVNRRHFKSPSPVPYPPKRLTECLSVTHAQIKHHVPPHHPRQPPAPHLQINLLAHAPCPGDLVLRLGTTYRPKRVDLLFYGTLNPKHLRRGDHLQSFHRLTAQERTSLHREPLRLGVLRRSGCRPEHRDPVSLEVPLHLSCAFGPNRQAPRRGTEGQATAGSGTPTQPSRKATTHRSGPTSPRDPE